MPRDFSHTTNFVAIDPVGWPSLAVNAANDVSISAAGGGNGGIATHADAPKITSAVPIEMTKREDMDPRESERRTFASPTTEAALSPSSIPSLAKRHHFLIRKRLSAVDQRLSSARAFSQLQQRAILNLT